MPHRSDIRFSGSARAEGAANCSAGTGFVRYLACAGPVWSSAHVAPGRPGPRSVRKRGPALHDSSRRVRRSAGIVLLCRKPQSAYHGDHIAGLRGISSYGAEKRQLEKCLNPRALNTRLGGQDKRPCHECRKSLRGLADSCAGRSVACRKARILSDFQCPDLHRGAMQARTDPRCWKVTVPQVERRSSRVSLLSGHASRYGCIGMQ